MPDDPSRLALSLSGEERTKVGLALAGMADYLATLTEEEIVRAEVEIAAAASGLMTSDEIDTAGSPREAFDRLIRRVTTLADMRSQLDDGPSS